MKHVALLLTVLASLPLAACSMAPGGSESGAEEQTSSKADPVKICFNQPATVIDFDVDTAGAAIADGTTVDNTYTSLGVTLGCMVCSSGHAFARSPGGRTGNGVSLIPKPTYSLYDSRFGAVRADFATPRSWVSIDVLAVLPPEYVGTPVARPWFEAFNAAGQLIGSTVYYPSYGSTTFGQWQTLRIDDPTGSIKFVRFSSQHFNSSPSVYGTFDNLSFNTDPLCVDFKPEPIPPRPIKPILLQPLP